MALAIADAGGADGLERALRSGRGLSVHRLDQPWWPGVPVLWAVAGRDQHSFARYLCAADDELHVLTDRPAAFDSAAEAPELGSEAEVLSYALFWLEVTRPLDRPVAVIEPSGPALDEPAWDAARALFGPGTLNLEARLDVLRRIARLIEDGQPIPRRDLARLQDAARAGGVDRLRRLPGRALSARERTEVASLWDGRHTAGRALKRLRSAEAFGPEGLMVDRATGLPGARFGRPISGVAGEVFDERLFGVERDPLTGLVARIPGGSGPVLTFAAPASPEWTRMSQGVPTSPPSTGRIEAPDGFFAFDASSELTLLDARGQASATWRWREERWVATDGPPEWRAEPPWTDEPRLRRALTAGVLLPRATGRTVELVVGIGAEVRHTLLEIGDAGTVREDSLRIL